MQKPDSEAIKRKVLKAWNSTCGSFVGREHNGHVLDGDWERYQN